MKALIILLLFFTPLVLHAQKTVSNPQIYDYDPKDTFSLRLIMQDRTVYGIFFQVIDTTSIPLKPICEPPNILTAKPRYW